MDYDFDLSVMWEATTPPSSVFVFFSPSATTNKAGIVSHCFVVFENTKLSSDLTLIASAVWVGEKWVGIATFHPAQE